MNENINVLLNRLVTMQNLSTYHKQLISVLGLVANTGDFEMNDTVEVPVYDETEKKWTKISTKISEAVSQLYSLVNTMGLDEDDFKASDYPYNVTTK